MHETSNGLATYFHLRTHCLAEQHSKPCCRLITVLARFCFITLLSNRSVTSLRNVWQGRQYVWHTSNSRWPGSNALQLQWKTMWHNSRKHCWNPVVVNWSRGTYFEKNSAQTFAEASVARMCERGVPKVQRHKMFRGLLHDILSETDLWIVSETHSLPSRR